MTRRILRLKDVKEATGLSRSSIYALRKRGLFPASVRIGPKAVGWFEDEILGYLKSRPRVGGDARNADQASSSARRLSRNVDRE